MNVASLELCKELFKLSKWSGTAFSWFIDDDGEWLYKATFEVSMLRDSYPAYDLGYLLRNLPPIQLLNKDFDAYASLLSDEWEVKADTPENAVATLAIGLLKQGVLTSEHKPPKGDS